MLKPAVAAKFKKGRIIDAITGVVDTLNYVVWVVFGLKTSGGIIFNFDGIDPKVSLYDFESGEDSNVKVVVDDVGKKIKIDVYYK